MRTFLAAVVGIIAGCLTFMAMSLTLAWWTAGTASNLSSTVVSILDTPDGASALGSALMDEALASAPARERAILAERAPELAAVAGKALSVARDALGDLVAAAFTAIVSGAKVVLDLGPILRPVLSAMHQVDPSIPATLDGNPTFDFDGSRLEAVATAIGVLGLWWVLAVVAIGLVVATAFASRHGSWRRWRAAGIALAAPALVFLLLALVTAFMRIPLDAGDFTAKLIDAAIAVVRTKGIIVSVLAGVLGAALIGISFVPARPASVPSAEPAS